MQDASIHVFLHTHTCRHIHTQDARIHAWLTSTGLFSSIYTSTPTHTHTHTHTHAHTITHARTHTHTHQHTHTHTCMQDASIHASLTSAGLFASIQDDLQHVASRSAKVNDIINSCDSALTGMFIMYIYVYVCMCVCLCICVYLYQHVASRSAKVADMMNSCTHTHDELVHTHT